MAVNPIQAQKYLKGMDYPASKDDIVKKAKEEGADDELQDTLQRLPEDTDETPADVSKAIGALD